MILFKKLAILSDPITEKIAIYQGFIYKASAVTIVLIHYPISSISKALLTCITFRIIYIIIKYITGIYIF